jgi:hypothetical protein
MSTLLGGWPHHAYHGHWLPLQFFNHKLLPALVTQPAVLEFPISVGAVYHLTLTIHVSRDDAVRDRVTFFYRFARDGRHSTINCQEVKLNALTLE